MTSTRFGSRVADCLGDQPQVLAAVPGDRHQRLVRDVVVEVGGDGVAEFGHGGVVAGFGQLAFGERGGGARLGGAHGHDYVTRGSQCQLALHCQVNLAYTSGMTTRYLDEGYAAGSTDGGQWLTVWGSFHRSDLVFATREEAEVRALDLRGRSVPDAAATVIVCRVRREDGFYRILPEPAAA